MKFEEWFVMQMGERPTQKHVRQLYDDIGALQVRLNEVQNLLAATIRWDQQREAALYAWQAREKEMEKENA